MSIASTYEKAFLTLSAVVFAVFLTAAGYSVVGLGIHLPGQQGVMDPRVVAQTPPFDQPGVRQVGPGQYEVTMMAQAWSFNPSEVQVPVGSTVSFNITSRDVVHGLQILKTDVNVMVMPGELTSVTVRFDHPGEYWFICHEYCGVGHQGMFGKVVVQ